MISTALDVAVGLVFVFLMLSVVCSMLNEQIQTLLKTRATMLENTLRQLIGEGALLNKVREHPLVQALSQSPSSKPSYLPSSTFALALFDSLKPENDKLTIEGLRNNVATIAQNPVPSAASGSAKALLVLLDSSASDLAVARAKVENWFDNAMDRLSGSYKRHVTKWIFVLGFAVAALTNADTIVLFQRLEHEGALRAAVTAQASRVDTNEKKISLDKEQLAQMSLLFWDDKLINIETDEAEFPRAFRQPELSLSWTKWVILKVLGFLMTALAVSLGAPFWFDLLGRITNLRAAGAKPARGSEASKGQT